MAQLRYDQLLCEVLLMHVVKCFPKIYRFVGLSCKTVGLCWFEGKHVMTCKSVLYPLPPKFVLASFCGHEKDSQVLISY